jgi:hypothetical protein
MWIAAMFASTVPFGCCRCPNSLSVGFLAKVPHRVRAGHVQSRRIDSNFITVTCGWLVGSACRSAPPDRASSGREDMRIIAAALSLAAGTLLSGVVLADSYSDTIDVFRKAGASASYFDRSHGYAVFPTVGKGGLIIGGAHGTGRVYQNGQYVGDTSMTQVSVGLQVGGRPTVRSSSSKTSAPSRNSRPETLSSTPG